MAKKNDAVQKFIAEFFKDEDTDEYVTGEAANVLREPEAKVDMIAAGAVLMMARLAEKNRVHIVDCVLAVPKWAALIVASEVVDSENRRENDE